MGKRICRLLLAVMAMLVLSMQLVFAAAEGEASSSSVIYSYKILENGTVEIVKMNTMGEKLVIPNRIDGYDATSIGEQAFQGCVNLKSITIPDSIVNIASNAFESVDGFTICCANGSYAETYAKSQGFAVQNTVTGEEEQNPSENPSGGNTGNETGENPSGGNTGNETGGNTPGDSAAGKQEQTIQSEEDLAMKVGDPGVYLDATADGGGTLTYESKNPDIAAVDGYGTVTAVAVGTAKIVITAPESSSFKAARKIVTVTVIPEDYTPISNIGELSAIRNNPSGKYILVKDIDMSEATAPGGSNDCGTGWDSIETFCGTLDGNGHRIIGMHIFGETAASDIGLFEVLDGTVKNLGVKACEISVSAKNTSGTNIGAIAGSLKTWTGIIANCYASGTITLNECAASCDVGGLVGYKRSSGSVEDSFNTCKIDISPDCQQKNNIGGICGRGFENRIARCYNAGKISGNDKSAFGAITGCGYMGLKNCHYLQGTAARGQGDYADDANCVALTESQMRNGNYFTGFDFTDIWEVDPYCEAYPYPQFKNNRMIRVKSIEMSPAPSKLKYSQGEPLSLRGAGLKITYEDGIETTIPLSANMLSGYNMAQIGEQIVAVAYGGVETSFDIEVSAVAVSGITLPQQISLYRAKERRLTVAITPNNASDKSVTWQSDNPNVASVDSSGLVRAKARGTAVITATASNGLQASCTVTVLVPAVAINLSQASLTLNVGERFSLYAQVSPMECTDAIQWKSSNPAVADVSDGNVVAQNAGTATVSAYTDNGVTANCTVIVQKASSSGSGNTGGGSGNGNGNISGGSGNGKPIIRFPQVDGGSQNSGNTGSSSTNKTAQAIKKTKSTKAKIKSAKNVKTRSIKLKLSGLSGCTGYKIQYGTRKSFAGAKTITKKSGTVTIKKLKAKKTYYIRVRVYKKISGKTYYGKWSSRKSVKIKK